MNDHMLLSRLLTLPPLSYEPGSWKTVSSFGLALVEAREATGRDRTTGERVKNDPPTQFLGAVGYMCLLDLIGTAFESLKTDRRQTRVTSKGFRRALERFTDLGQDRIDVLYALRCALVHDYSLMNNSGPKELDHVFTTAWDEHTPLIELPEEQDRWDGRQESESFERSGSTTVNLLAFIDICESVVKTICDLHSTNDLALAIPSETVNHRYLMWRMT
jgi:hypothetical protein